MCTVPCQLSLRQGFFKGYVTSDKKKEQQHLLYVLILATSGYLVAEMMLVGLGRVVE